VARTRTGAGILTLITLGLFTELYLLGSLAASPVGKTLAVLSVGAVVGLAFWRPRIGLGVAAAALLSQIGTAIVLRPSKHMLVERPVAARTAPSVIHIVLDEHGSIDALPEPTVSAGERHELTKSWERLGFTLFNRAYTAEAATHLTIARLWNPRRHDPDSAVQRGDGPEAFIIKEHDQAAEITAKRVLDITGMSYVSLRPIIATRVPVTRLFQQDYPRATAGIAAARLPVVERLKIMLARIMDWIVRSARSQAAKALGEATGLLHRDGGLFYSWRSAYGLTGKHALDALGDRLSCCGTRGTYYYAHVLLPHWPYVFKSDCSVRPVTEWLYNEVHELLRTNTLATRAERYRLYLDQARCTQRVIARLVASIDGNPALADATIMVHGDHGARISLKPSERIGISEAEYSDATFELDRRATLFALRRPGHPPHAEHRPVRIDALVQALRDSDFASYDAALAADQKSSPFAAKAAR
jgi:hypothetical protein